MQQEGPLLFSSRLPGVPRSVPEVRHDVRAALERAGIDPFRVELAVSEAFSNAVQHGYRGVAGWVEIEIGLAEDVVKVTVRDYGVGLSTHPQSEGLGVGLMMIRSLTERLELEGGPGVGTTVRMSFAYPSVDTRQPSLAR